MTKLVLLVIVAWTLQGLLTLLQYKRFQNRFNSLAGKYNLGVGHHKTPLGIGVLVIVSADEAGKIQAIDYMKGISVFADFRKYDGFTGRSIEDDFEENTLFKGVMYKALQKAINNLMMKGAEASNSFLH